MKIILVHLSDIHLREDQGSNPILGRIDQLAAAVASTAPDPAACFVIASGDVALSGKTEEYARALAFIHDLKDRLRTRLNLADIPFLACPGNHDCDFALQTTLREIILADTSRRELDDSVIEACAQVLSPFFSFISGGGSSLPPTTSSSKAIISRTIKVNGLTVHFSLLNTALFSTINERQGCLQFPTQLIPEPSVGTTPPSLSITVFHHPYLWLESSVARPLRRALEATSDIVLTGHEHEADSYAVSRHPSQEVEYLEGGVLQDLDDIHSSSFNTLVVDLQEASQCIHRFSWSRKEGRYEEEASPTTLPFLRNALRFRNTYVLSSQFEQELAEPGANYTHSAKKTITLDDIFIYPNIRVVSNISDEPREPTLVREDIPSFAIEARHLLVLGPEMSGKSSLAKTLFQDLRKRGKIPLLLDGRSIKRTDDEVLDKVLTQAFESQYQSPDYAAYAQLPSETRAVIVDDIHLLPLGARGRDRVIRHLQTRAAIIILFGDDPARFDDVPRQRSDRPVVLSYTTCAIMPFGHLKRADLVKKWVFLGRSLTHEDRDLLRQAQHTERVLTDLIGMGGVIPSFPLFILVLLQELEMRRSIDISPASSSYGFLCEALLTTALANASQLKLDLDTQYSYLAELAFHLFSRRSMSLSKEEAYDWHHHFCEKYGRRLDFETLSSTFASASVLAWKQGEVSFRYPYLYYYFLGRYFRDHISEDAICTHIRKMASRLYHEESANVLLYLTYLSKDSLILDAILASSRQLFSDTADCDLVTDSDFLPQLIADIPKLVIEGPNSEARRRELLAAKDKQDIGTTELAANEPPTQDGDDFSDRLNDILRINMAFKSIQILGQVLRNYPGSLEASMKLTIAKELYSLALRTLKVMFNAVEQSREDLVHFLSDLVRERCPRWPDERISDRVTTFVFALAEGLAFIVTKHVADSAGDEALAVTYDALLREYPSPSARVIDLAIHLFHFSDFPEAKTVDLYRDIHKHHFVTLLVRRLVWYYFYIMPARQALISSICTRLEIELHPAIVADDRPKMIAPR
jgi:hypothetical protein